MEIRDNYGRVGAEAFLESLKGLPLDNRFENAMDRELNASRARCTEAMDRLEEEIQSMLDRADADDMENEVARTERYREAAMDRLARKEELRWEAWERGQRNRLEALNETRCA